eukprot:14072616-Heterocapsa_arctica.AAC.1
MEINHYGRLAALAFWVAMLNFVEISTVKFSSTVSNDLKKVKDYALQTFRPSDVQDMVPVCQLIRSTKKEP